MKSGLDVAPAAERLRWASAVTGVDLVDLGTNGSADDVRDTANAQPLLVALAEIGLESGVMLPENAAALVGAGVLSVIVFPAIAVALGHSGAQPLVAAPGRDGSK